MLMKPPPWTQVLAKLTESNQGSDPPISDKQSRPTEVYVACLVASQDTQRVAYHEEQTM